MRTTRNLDDATKKKISDSMKLNHQHRSDAERASTSQKQSDALKRYWATIPKAEKPDYDLI